MLCLLVLLGSLPLGEKRRSTVATGPKGPQWPRWDILGLVTAQGQVKVPWAALWWRFSEMHFITVDNEKFKALVKLVLYLNKTFSFFFSLARLSQGQNLC